MIAPQGYWHLRGRARQIAKAKFVRYYEENRHLKPELVLDDYCHKYHLAKPDVEVSFAADGRLLLRRGGKQYLLATDTPVNVARLVFRSLSKPLSACGGESTNLTRQENNND